MAINLQKLSVEGLWHATRILPRHPVQVGQAIEIVACPRRSGIDSTCVNPRSGQPVLGVGVKLRRRIDVRGTDARRR